MKSFPWIALLLLTILLPACDRPPSDTDTKEALTTAAKTDWWKEAIVYQIYPRSFKDTDGDGVGDLAGIIEKLDYIQDLGVTAVWLNPIYSSPNDDNGYDVSDYRGIMADFGTMEDFDRMLSGMHERGIKLIMDVVVNHSSDEHPWFVESRSSRDNPYRDYYHWWPAERGKPAYRYSLFDENGDAWKYDSLTDAYYLHYFSRKQPDLNWENPRVRQEVYDIMTFWAEKGVDGFRLDAFQFAAKDTTFPAFPQGFEENFMPYYAMQGKLHDYLREMNEEVLSKYDVMAVAEGAGNSFSDAHDLVDADRNELDMAYAFDGVDIAKPDGYELDTLKAVFSRWDSAFAKNGWLSIFLSNHDQARLVSRYGNDSPELRAPSAKLLNTFILTMRGTPYCYYGDELGMTNSKFKQIEDYQDIAAVNGYKKVVNQGGNVAEYLRNLSFSSRDNGRTPMQWTAAEQAGFTTGTPWLPVNANHTTINVAAQRQDSASVLNYFRQLTTLRRENPALVYGAYRLVQPEHPTIYAYTRDNGDQRMLVVLNFSERPATIDLSDYPLAGAPAINNYAGVRVKEDRTELLPYQAVVWELE